MRKIELIIDPAVSKKIYVNSEKIEKQVSRFLKLLNRQTREPDRFWAQSRINGNIRVVTILLRDLNYNVNDYEVRHIIHNKNPNNEMENLAINIYDALKLFLGQKKFFQSNNVHLLRQMLFNNTSFDHAGGLFRQTNDSAVCASVVKEIIDFHRLPPIFEELITFVNTSNIDFEPSLISQILYLYNLVVSPFANQNELMSKFLAVWHLELEQKKQNFDLPIELYLETMQLNEHQLHTKIQKCITENDYTEVLAFFLTKLSKTLEMRHKVEIIAKLLHQRKRVFLAPQEGKFLFWIMYFELRNFDWKLFKKIVRHSFTKQYIMRNLGKLDEYDLLTSSIIKNRKFFTFSRFLVTILNNWKKEKSKNNSL